MSDVHVCVWGGGGGRGGYACVSEVEGGRVGVRTRGFARLVLFMLI